MILQSVRLLFCFVFPFFFFFFFFLVFGAKVGKESVSNNVQSLLSRYEENSLDAVTELVSFMLRAAGNSVEVSAEEVENVDASALVAKIVTDEFRAQTSYPLWSQKGFAEVFGSFWQKLVLQSGDILFDEYLLAHVNIWVEMLSNWEARPLRHVGTVVGLELISGLISLRKKMVGGKSKNAKKKSKSQEAGTQSDDERVKEIEGMIENLINTVFVVRYRDVWPELRSLCIRSLGSWIFDYEDVLMDTKYVKYLGWALFDQKAPVRLEAVKALSNLYGDKDRCAKLEKFSERFQDRIGALPDDKDLTVAVAGIKMCTLLAQAEQLNDAHVHHIYELLVDKNASIRTAAGDFAIRTFFAESERNESKGLLEFLQGHKILQENPEHVIRALWTDKDAAWLRDWNAFCDALLRDDTLKAKDQEMLAHCLIAAAKLAIEGSSKTDKKDAGTLSDALVTFLPKLLKRFKAEASIVAPLISLVRFMDPEQFSVQHKAANHKKLVELLGQLFVDRTAETLVQSSLAALCHLGDPSFPLAAEARSVLDRIVQQVLTGFEELAATIPSEDEPDEETVFALKGALTRLSVASAQTDVRLGRQSYLALRRLLDEFVAGVASWMTPPMVRHALESLVTDMMWSLSRVLKNDAGNSASGSENVRELQIKRDDVLVILEKMLGLQSAPVALEVAALRCATDVLNLFGAYLNRKGLGTLSVACPVALADNLKRAFHRIMEGQRPKTADSSSRRKSGGKRDKKNEEEEEEEISEEEDQDEENDEKSDEERGSIVGEDLEVLVVSAIAKAVQIRSLPIGLTSDVIMHLASASSSVSKQVMRDLLSKLRKDCEAQGRGEQEYKFVFGALKAAFQMYRQSREYDEDRRALRELALALVRSYGVNVSSMHKKSIVLLMQEAIPYALEQGDVGFVFLRECLIPFSSKMPQPDVVLEFFEKQKFPEGTEDSPHYAALEEFRNHLRKLADPSSFKPPLSKRASKKAKTTSSATNRRVLQFEAEEGQEEQQQQQQDEEEEEGSKGKEEENDQENDDGANKKKKKRERAKKAKGAVEPPEPAVATKKSRTKSKAK